MTPQESAIRDYRLYWAELSMEADDIERESREAGPLRSRRLRNQAVLVRQYATICHHAAWREEHPEEPVEQEDVA